VATKTGIVPVPVGLLKKSGVEDSGKGQGNASANSASEDVKKKTTFTPSQLQEFRDILTKGLPLQ
jgi:hypothetical protein